MRNSRLAAYTAALIAVLVSGFGDQLLAVPAQAALVGGGAAPDTWSTAVRQAPALIDRDSRGRVLAVRSRGGSSLAAVPAGTGPCRAALRHAADYAPAFGISGADLTVARVAPSAAGGSVVRLRQDVGGVPVLGGELVESLDRDGGLLSLSGHVVRPSAVEDPTGPVPAARDVAVARAAVAKHRRQASTRLTAVDGGTWVYDPSLLGVRGGLGPRLVRRIEVTDGAAVRDLVLVDAVTGRVLLDLDEIQGEGLDRQVCDDQNVQQHVGACAVSTAPARTETGPTSGVDDVNQAWELTGATAHMYADVAGLDLTQLIGSGGTSTGGSKKLASWVRYCPAVADDPTCPMQNAFWNGTEMFFGAGYAGADDVVGHELTHGVIEKFSNLFYFHQSGAINESLADVMGEILDHRHTSPSDTPDDWQLGEDLPGGATRDLADPTRHGQPDRMTSALWDADPQLQDNGGVHADSGVGNKTAYLISQGGTFNGQTVRGIDAGDPALTKTATLYVEVIKRLTSGAQYADLGRTLEQACTELASVGTVGFTGSDCDSVTSAVRATELESAPTVPGAAPPADVPASCPSGAVKVSLFDNDGSLSGLNQYPTTTPLWTTAPNASWGVPPNARTGHTSIFGADPDPHAFGDPFSSSVTMNMPVTLPADQPAYLHFDQWRLFEWSDGTPPTYHDGGTVTVFAPDATDSYVAQPLPDDAWVNGPGDPLLYSGVRAFGGDSNGWTSSRLDLSSLAGRRVIVRWTVRGDGSGSFVGWFLDNLSIYSCHTPVAPGAVTDLATTPLPGPRVGLAWQAPNTVGDGLTGYRLTRSDGAEIQLPADSTTYTTGALVAGRGYAFTVRPIGPGTRGPATTAFVDAPRISLTASASRVRKGATVKLSGTVAAVDSAHRAGRGSIVRLQWRPVGTSTWRWKQPNGDPLESVVGARGSFVVSTAVARAADYRATYSIPYVYPGWFPGTSTAVRVRVAG